LRSESRAEFQFPIIETKSGHRLDQDVPGRNRILERYRDFSGELPALLEAVEQDRESITFAEFRDYVERYVITAVISSSHGD
jgi:hypothetical protein